MRKEQKNRHRTGEEQYRRMRINRIDTTEIKEEVKEEDNIKITERKGIVKYQINSCPDC
jgi:hypothetical protein